MSRDVGAELVAAFERGGLRRVEVAPALGGKVLVIMTHTSGLYTAGLGFADALDNFAIVTRAGKGIENG